MAKSEIKSKPKDKGCLALALTDVLIPSVGRVNLHQGHVSFYKSVTGSSDVSFASVMDLRKLVCKARGNMLKGRPGSEGQSLAFFMKMEDVANGAIQVDGIGYAAMAKLWNEYCNTRYKDAEGKMLPYGKSVARTMFIGFPKLGQKWRQGHTSFPLHTVPCDVCLFIVTVARKDRPSENPYSCLDLKSIHEFFASKMVAKKSVDTEEEFESDEETPDYQPESPVIPRDDGSDSSGDEAPGDEQQQDVVDVPQEEKHRAGKRKRGKGVGMVITDLPKELFPTKKGGKALVGTKQAVQAFVPGEFEW